MTVILSWKTADYTVPDPPTNCTMCGDDLQPPFVHWWCCDGHILICAECCNWSRRGLMADMERTDAIGQALKPDHPALQTAQ
jgi:hypothetical protein